MKETFSHKGYHFFDSLWTFSVQNTHKHSDSFTRALLKKLTRRGWGVKPKGEAG